MSIWDSQRDHSYWKKRRGRVATRTGVILKNRKDLLFMGHRQFGELAIGTSYGKLQFLAVAGRMPTEAEEQLMDSMVGVTTYGDPRLWFLSTARWAASMRAPVGAALAAAISVVDSRVFGGLATFLVASYLQKALGRVRAGETTVASLVEESLTRREIIPGFGRPLVRRDERVAILLDRYQELGFQRGAHLGLALDIEAELLDRKDIGLNFGGLVSAVLSDMGFTPRQINLLCITHFIPSIFAAICEGYEKPPAEFLPQECEDVEYQGAAYRAVPGA
ncbi:MAG: hypothetical protein HY303_02110 [Candidatus Wallbacteria bacterium]|nr:hypothetical protein [Candidatus Wallbacteria bacterium]